MFESEVGSSSVAYTFADLAELLAPQIAPEPLARASLPSGVPISGVVRDPIAGVIPGADVTELKAGGRAV